jgi:hypothetical protein
MVEPSKIHMELTSTFIDSDFKIQANKFVTQNAGKLRDYYRIGKMLGSGKCC